MIQTTYLPLLLLLLAATTHQQAQVGFAYSPNPDVIKCGNYFYYLMKSQSASSTFNAFSGSSSAESYNSSNGVLSGKQGSLPGNCNNEKIESLWANNRAFRLFNLGRRPDRSIQYSDKYPDVIKCQKGNILYRSNKSLSSMLFQNPSGPEIQFRDSDSSVQQKFNIQCGGKTLEELVSDSETFNITTQAVQQGSSYISMTGKYPDFLKCDHADLYIHYISDDESKVIYKNPNPNDDMEIQFVNGNYSSSKFGSILGDCKKSINDIIVDRKAYNLNTPILTCPDDITSENPLANFKAYSTGHLNLNYSKQPNNLFPVGRKTKVKVSGTHSNSNINLSCTFDVDIPDRQPPNLTCPDNIQQQNPVVNFAATLSDNGSSYLSLQYSPGPGSEFPVGTTEVTVSAIDNSGHQSHCKFNVTIKKTVDREPPSLKCPDNIRTNNRLVNFAATASDRYAGSLNVFYSKAPGSEFSPGSTMVVVTAFDGGLNISHCIFFVEIV